jgi:hypothetical protein
MSEARDIRRMPSLIALAVLLVAVGVADRATRPSLTPSGERLATAYAPTASPPDALTSNWYCPAGTSAQGGTAEATTVIVNPTARRLQGTIDGVGVDGSRASKAITVEPRSRVGIPNSEVLRNAYVAIHVQLDGGGAFVEHSVAGTTGEAHGPCGSSASTRWYMPEGATTRAATLIYELFNPFPDDAIVDMSFSTDEGRVAPAAFQGLVVPANGLLPVDIGGHVRRRAHVSGEIRVRRGRIVAEQLQVHNGEGRKGLGLMLGAPRRALGFVFPDGVAGPRHQEQLHFFNPNDQEATVSLDLVLDSDEAQPFEIHVPARDRVTIDLSAESRIPKDVGHAMIVRVQNNVPIAVARTIDVGSPGARSAYLIDTGATSAARHWGFASGGSSPTQEEFIAISNEADHAVTVSITTPDGSGLTTLPNLASITIPRGARKALRLADFDGKPQMPLIVNASGPVVVERSIYKVNGLGASASMGIVLSTDHG